MSPETPVPCLRSGEVIAIFKDFIHSTLIVRHGDVIKAGRVLCSVFGHCVPAVRVGKLVRAHETIGKIAANKRTSAPAHLHLSAAWLNPKAPVLCGARFWKWRPIWDPIT